MNSKNINLPPFTGQEADWAWETFDPSLVDSLEVSEPVKDGIKPLMWLIGKWESIAAEIVGDKVIKYKEQLQFSFTGQPLLNYRARSWKPDDKTPMHFETGYLRIKPNTNVVSLVTAHNFGVTIVEEGTIDHHCLKLKSVKLGRSSFAKPPEVLAIIRTYTYLKEVEELHMKADMATTEYQLKPHLSAVYKRIA